MNPSEPDKKRRAELEAMAEETPAGFLRELWDFLVHNKKWWLVPIVAALVLLAILVVLSGSGAFPWIYTFV